MESVELFAFMDDVRDLFLNLEKFRLFPSLKMLSHIFFSDSNRTFSLGNSAQPLRNAESSYSAFLRPTFNPTYKQLYNNRLRHTFFKKPSQLKKFTFHAASSS
jgi:hypothetical protein